MIDRTVMEVRGVMTRFEPLTEEIVEKESQGSLTMSDVAQQLSRFGLSIKHIVYDPSRSAFNTFYADYENGLYALLFLNREYLAGGPGVKLLTQLKEMHGKSPRLKGGEWEVYYLIDVPLQMAIYDFQRRYRDIPEPEVFKVWLMIHHRIDYSNDMWRPEILEYVFDRAPRPPELPEPDADGLVTLYRGMGELSQAPEQAISWSVHAGNALWFANRSGFGTKIAVARVRPSDIISYLPGFSLENEVILRPGTPMQLRYEDMIPATRKTMPGLLWPAMTEFTRYGAVAKTLGYPDAEKRSVHGVLHILRVLLLSLIYFYDSHDPLTKADKQVLIYFSLLHDIGRSSEDVEPLHGDQAVERIHWENIRVKGLRLAKKDYKIAELLIRHHCRDDDEGRRAIRMEPGLTAMDEARALHLYDICKDMDGLDRVRFNGLDYRMLRTPYGRQLPLIAGNLLRGNVEALLDYFNKEMTD